MVDGTLQDERARVSADLESPVSTGERRRMLMSAALAVSAFYVFHFVSVLVLSLLLLLEVAVGIALARAFAFYFLSKPIQWLGTTVLCLLRSLSVGRDETISVELNAQNAPGLFAMARDVAERVGIGMPAKVHLIGGTDAAVSYRGLWPGTRSYELWISYDLIAGLSEDELKSFIAHELGHARSARMGLHVWLANGMTRMGRVSESLGGMLARLPEGSRAPLTTRTLLSTVGALTRTAVRASASHSRQGEFSADRQAAEICGGDALKHALVRLHALADAMDRLNWRQHVVHVRRGDYSTWLLSKLSSVTADDLDQALYQEDGPGDRQDWATHPTLLARLRALGGLGGSVPVDGASSLGLLSDPDSLAAELVALGERRVAADELKQSLELRKSARGWLKGRKSRLIGLVLFGVALIGAVLLCVIGLAPISDVPLWFRCCTMMAVVGSIGIWYALNRASKAAPLPVPEFGAWLDAVRAEQMDTGDGRWQDELAQQLRSGVPADARGKRAQGEYWTGLCSASISTCDYRRALVSANECLRLRPKSSTALLTMGIASAYLEPQHGSTVALDMAAAGSGLTPSTALAFGLACANYRNWDLAEGYLATALKHHPAHADLAAILAVCQTAAGRMHLAVENLRTAMSLAPGRACFRTQLASTLIRVGHPDEALSVLGEAGAEDYETLSLLTHGSLLMGRRDEGQRLAERMIASADPRAQGYLDLGWACMDSELPELASRYYESACSEGYYPEALVGMARVSADVGDHERTRSLLRSALDLTRELGPRAAKPLDLLPSILPGLLSTGGPPAKCAGWTTSINLSGNGLDGDMLDLLIYAPDRGSALQHAQWLVDAMFPDRMFLLGPVDLQNLHADNASDIQVVPGIHNFRIQRAN